MIGLGLGDVRALKGPGDGKGRRMHVWHGLAGRIADVSADLAPRLWPVFGAALAASGLAALLWPGLPAEALAAAAAALAGLCLTVWAVTLVRDWRRRNAWHAVREVLALDPVPALIAEPTGEIWFSNRAAKAAFGSDPDTITDIVADRFADPEATIRRLQARAWSEGATDAVTAAGSPAHRLSAQRVADGILWRLAPIGAADPETPDAPAMPMLTLGPGHRILAMNAAMQALLGGRPGTLDRVIADLPLRDGDLHRVLTPSGPRDLRVAAIKTGAGQRQVYLWPGAVSTAPWAPFDALPLPVLKLAPDGAILGSNRRARAMLNLAPETENFVDAVEGLGRSVKEWLIDMAAGRGLDRTEVVRARRTEVDTFLQVALGRVRTADEISLLAVLTDATELKTLEAQFVQSQKMQAIGQLAGGVAHDFNNLLTAISGHCDLLLLRHDAGDPDYADLMQINQNANRAAGLVGQLLAFSRKQTMRPTLIDLRDTVGELTHLLNRLVGEKVRLVFIQDAALPQVRVDRRQLEQVIMNLVVNARDAMPEGGEVRIVTRTEHLAQALTRDRASVPAGDYVVVAVEDEGCGIPPDRLGKIFEPFYTTKKVGEGTGLGLSTAYGIVKQSGGFIFADSTPGVGSRFQIYLPAHRGRPLEAPETPATADSITSVTCASITCGAAPR